MLQCPACDNILNQDFGMVTCENCGKVLMIDISGKVSAQTDAKLTTPEQGFSDTNQPHLEEQPMGEILSGSGKSPMQEDSSEEDPLEEQGPLLAEDPLEQNSVEDDLWVKNSDPMGQDSTEENLQEDSNSEDFFEEQSTGEQSSEDFHEESFDSEDSEATRAQETEDSREEFLETLEDSSEEKSQQSSQDQGLLEDSLTNGDSLSSPDSEPVDITDFADSEKSGMNAGEYLYDLIVDGLDSKELKEELKYVLMEERLQLNYREFLKKIRKGKVLISDLNPVKAKRIVEQLQYSGLNLRWRQKRVIME